MKRRIFFWLQKLKISPAERRTVSGLIIFLALLAIANAGISPSSPFEDDDQYRELEEHFRKRTAMLRERRQEQMKQYYPPPENQNVAVRADTIPGDTTTVKPIKKQLQDTLIRRINVNTATKQELETLPGIGPAYAQRIIDYRREQGGFSTIEELKKIKGIAQKRLEKLKPFVKLKDSK